MNNTLRRTVLAILCMHCFTVFGVNYYVNDGSTVGDVYTSAPGNSLNNGLSPLTPLALPSEVLNTYTLAGGDTVFIDAGTYTDELLLNNLNGAGSFIVFQGADSSLTTITGNNGTNASAVLTPRELVVQFNNSDYINLRGLSIKQSAGNDWALQIYNGSSNNLIEECFVSAYYGIDIWNGINSDNEIDNCQVYSTYVGIRLKDGTQNTHIHDSYINTTATNIFAALEFQNSSNNLVERNTFVSDGLSTEGTIHAGKNSTNNVLYNNYLINRSTNSYVIDSDFGDEIIMVNNSVYAEGSIIHFEQITAGVDQFQFTLESNIFYSANGHGIVLPTNTVKLDKTDNNLWYTPNGGVAEIGGVNYALGAWQTYDPDNSGDNAPLSLVGDPLYVNQAADDLSLLCLSPARDVGDNNHAIVDDRLQNARPIGPAIDIGAFEFTESFKLSLSPKDSTICSGSPIDIEASGIFTSVSWLESIDGQTFSPYTGPTTNDSIANYTLSNSSLVNDTLYVLAQGSSGCLNEYSDTARIIILPQPGPANAGNNDTLCDSVATLVANPVYAGTGTWNSLGSAVLSTPLSSTTTVADIVAGDNEFVWTVTIAGCGSTSDTVNIWRHEFPSQANAGTNDTICSNSTGLSATNPIVGNGTWTIDMGGGAFVDETSASTGINNLNTGTNRLIWTIQNGNCPVTRDSIYILVDELPDSANAGLDQALCTDNTNLGAIAPIVGQGRWIILSGSAQIADSLDPLSALTTIPVGNNDFGWITSNGVCPADTDLVLITRTATAQVSVSLIPLSPAPVCLSLSETFHAIPVNGGTNPSYEWYVNNILVQGPSAQDSLTSTFVNGDSIFVILTSNEVCASNPVDTSEAVYIVTDSLPSVAQAGTDQNICSTSTLLNATAVTSGTGSWTVLQGPANIVSTSDPNTSVTGMSLGTTVELVWTTERGVCPSDQDTVLIIIDTLPDQAITSANTTICSDTSAINANLPASGTGVWSTLGLAIIGDSSLNSTTVSNLEPGSSTFVWTISNGTCPQSSDTLEIMKDQEPDAAIAPPNDTICASTYTLAGNTPTIGIGTWTRITGSGSITSPDTSNSGLTGLNAGFSEYEWRIENGTCPAQADTFGLFVSPETTQAATMPDDTICGDSLVIAANLPGLNESGNWTTLFGSSSISDANSTSTQATNLSGTDTWLWTISNGICPDTRDTLTIWSSLMPDSANAGLDQSLCADSSNLGAISPTIGQGRWITLTGSALISDSLDAQSALNSIPLGNTNLAWITSNGACPSDTDEVLISRALTADVSVSLIPLSPAPVCLSLSETFYAIPVNGGTNPSYEWYVNNILVQGPSTQDSLTSTFSDGDSIFVVLSSNEACASDPIDTSSAIYIVADSLPSEAEAGADQNVCSTSSSLNATVVTSGTGSWSVLQGPANITDASDPSTAVSGIQLGTTVELVWTTQRGVCPSDQDTVLIVIDTLPDQAITSPNSTICLDTSAISANLPTSGIGMWSTLGLAIITDSSLNSTTVSNLELGSNTLVWTISNGTCPQSSDTLEIIRDQEPDVAIVPPNDTICASTYTLAGNTPTTGTGTWTRITGSGSITTPIASNSGLTGLSTGFSEYEWRIENGTCPAQADTFGLFVSPVTTQAVTMPDDTLCGDSLVISANLPGLNESGNWTTLFGSSSLSDPNSASTQATNLSGTDTWLWTISNGICPDTRDTLTIWSSVMPDTANAGIDQNICGDTAYLSAILPAGTTGFWEVVSSTGQIDDNADINTLVTVLNDGSNSFRWIISNDICPADSDEVIINKTDNAAVDVLLTPGNQTICQGDSVTLNAIAVNGGNDPQFQWFLNNSSIQGPNNVDSLVVAPSNGDSVFVVLTSDLSCAIGSPSTSVAVYFQVDLAPSDAEAGPDQVICSSSTTLDATVPFIGDGVWSILSGSGNIQNNIMPASPIDGLAVGINQFTWSMTNGACPSSIDTVDIEVIENNLTANAGDDEDICDDSLRLKATIPSFGATGRWTVTQGSGQIEDSLNPFTVVKNLSVGNNRFAWEVSDGICPSSGDQVVIRVSLEPSLADAGPDQELCVGNTILEGNAPAIGAGQWTRLGGDVTFADSSVSNTSIIFASPDTFSLVWTISNGACDDTRDTMNIQTVIAPPFPEAGNDTTICADASVLDASSLEIGETGLWSTLVGSGSISDPSAPQTAIGGLSIGTNMLVWTVTKSVCPVVTDTVTIEVQSITEPADAGSDSIICGNTLQLSANLPVSSSGSWATLSGNGSFDNVQDPNSSFTSTLAGSQTLTWTLTSGICPVDIDTVEISTYDPIVKPDAGPDMNLCFDNASLILIGSEPLFQEQVEWQLLTGDANLENPDSDSLTLTANASGFIELTYTATNEACPSKSDTIQIGFQNPGILITPNDTSLCEQELSLSANVNVAGSVDWSITDGVGDIASLSANTIQLTNLIPGESTEIEIVAEDSLCPTLYETIIVERIYCDCELFVPTAISPNSDESNDTWDILGLDCYSKHNVKVYNRYGNVVYESTGFENWDGTRNGIPLPVATYYWVIEVETLIGETQRQTGPLTIMR